VTESIPWIKDFERLSMTELAPDFWRGTARYGFMERPDIPALLRQARAQGCPLQLDDVTYYVSHGTIVHREDAKGLAKWEEVLFAAMVRNAVHDSDFFRLPNDDVVEIGRQVAI
jgi:KUP system potassium uptake protein